MTRLRFQLAALFLALVAATFSFAQVKPPIGKEPPVKDKEKEKDKPTVTEIGGKSLNQWIKESRDPDPGVRENAVRTIMLFGPSGSPAASAIVERLRDSDVSLRVNAALALAAIDVSGPDIPKAVDALARRVTDDYESIVKFHAAIALATFGKDAKSAIPSLITASKDGSSWEIRKAACFALGRAGAATSKTDPLDMRAANALLYVLQRDHSALVRLEAAMALGSMGRPAMPSEQKLLEDALKHCANNDFDIPVRIWSVVGVLAINDAAPDQGLAAIAQFLKNKELVIRTHAARALGTIGPRAKSRVPDLVDMLSDKQPEGRLAAIWALAHIGEGAQMALPALKEFAERKDQDETLRQAAKEAIDAINGKHKK
jgi:HEAT repeat protein